MLRYPVYFAVAVFVLWALLFPSFRLLVTNQAQIYFFQQDGDSVVDLFRDGELIATQVGYGRINDSGGNLQVPRAREAQFAAL